MSNAIEQIITDKYALYLGDCCQVIGGLPDAKVGLSVFSPPFCNLYIYSDSECDMGNCKDSAEFFEHFSFLIGELYRVTIPGRLAVIHCKDLPRYYGRDGAAGLTDFPGEIIRAFEAKGWSYHSRVTIWKCPVVERERTNNNGLLHGTACRDRSQLRQGMADFLIVMRRPPLSGLASDEPVTLGRGDVAFEDYVGERDPDKSIPHPSPYARKGTRGGSERDRSILIWQRYADPVWFDINQQRVLNYAIARDDRDEKHICPLQLDVIERAIHLWSNPGDIVFSPFGGIGSEPYCALKLGRRAVAIELK
jgi:DNA modification methylase